MSGSSSDYEVQSQRSSAATLWGLVALLVVVVGVAALLWQFVLAYFGDDGVRVVAISFGVFVLVMSIISVGVIVMWISTWITQRHHDNVLRGLVRFQEADDRGEVARTVAGGVAGVLRTSNQVDSRMLTMADRLSRERLQMHQTQQAQQQAQLQAAADERIWRDAGAVDGEVKYEW